MTGIHGYVAAIGPANNRNYFTGVGYSAWLDNAKVFQTARGAKQAAQYWQTADHNPRPLGQAFLATLDAIPVELHVWDE